MVKVGAIPDGQDLVGTRVRSVFVVHAAANKQKWFHGTVTKVDNKLELMYITFEDGDEQAYTVHEAVDAVKTNELRFVEIIDLSSDD